MQVFIRINNGNIVLSNQILNTSNSLTLRLMEVNLVFCEYVSTQWRRSWGNYRIEGLNPKATMMVNERLKVRSFTIKSANNDGVTAH